MMSQTKKVHPMTKPTPTSNPVDADAERVAEEVMANSRLMVAAEVAVGLADIQQVVRKSIDVSVSSIISSL